jgi:hypothetical protein
MKLYTTLEIANEIGISPQSVLKRAKRLNIEPAKRILNKYCLFDADQKNTIIFLGSKIVRVHQKHEIEVIHHTTTWWIIESKINYL